jgi:hypothetical protein
VFRWCLRPLLGFSDVLDGNRIRTEQSHPLDQRVTLKR